MELWYTTTSPFARKVRIAAAELGLDGRISLVQVNPWTDGRLRALNPLAKVPTLVSGDGDVLFESAVICEWLDSVVPSGRLFPKAGPSRWTSIRLQGAADGAMTAVGRLFADERRSANERSDAVIARLAAARDSVLDWLEGQQLRIEPQIGEVAVAALLGYLDFRWPDRDWRAGRPRLSSWMDGIATRRSMSTTRHEAVAA